jgi:hypothetical protein
MRFRERLRWLRCRFCPFAWRRWRRCEPQRTISLAVVFEDEEMNSVSMLVGQSVVATAVPLEADGLTQTPSASVSGATWSAPSDLLASKDNGDGTVTLTAVKAGTASVIVSATVTDADGTTSSFSGTGVVTISEPPAPPARTASLGVSFSTPA